jgi:hypothetical protein
LRYRISYEEGMFEGGYGIPEPELVIRDDTKYVCIMSHYAKDNKA